MSTHVVTSKSRAPSDNALVHQAGVLRNEGGYWSSLVLSTREIGPGDVLEVLTRDARPKHLAAVVVHVIDAKRSETGWVTEVAHRLVHSGDIRFLLERYPDARTHACSRLEMRAEAYKLPTATFRDALLYRSLTEEMSPVEASLEYGRLDVVTPPPNDPVEPAPGYTVREHPTLGWIYVGKRDGRANGGRSRDETIAETWAWHDFDAKLVDEAKLQLDPVCSTCMGARVLRHADPAHTEEPCPDCPPMMAKGPSEWEAVERRVVLHEGEAGVGDGWSAVYEHVVMQKGEQRVSFLVAEHSDISGACGTAAVRPRGSATASVRQQWDAGAGVYSVALHGERCRDQVVDRLRCALRDGGIKP